MKKRLLLISYRFPPEHYPLALGLRGMLQEWKKRWTIDAVTAAREAASDEGITVHHVKERTPHRLFRLVRRLRLSKLRELFVWPDPFVLWTLPAFMKARRIIRERRPGAIVVFMMPFSTGFLGVLLKKATGLPLVLNLDDSPTCSDMRPTFPSRLHYAASRWMEDFFVRASDAVVYVSKHNMERVRARQPASQQSKFHLVRFGASLEEAPPATPRRHPDTDGFFRIAYLGAMSGWFSLLNDMEEHPFYKRLFWKWQRLGRFRSVALNPRTHSPVFVGQAVRRVLERHPEWQGRIEVHVYGDRSPKNVIRNVLRRFGLEDVVHVHRPVPHATAVRLQREAGLLFMTLPDRTDGTPGGRISAKTYEYLSTDRPILAALPPGENWEYLQGKAGTHLAAPKDVAGMAGVIEELASAQFAGRPTGVDRSELHTSLTGKARAKAFEQVLDGMLERDRAPVPQPA